MDEIPCVKGRQSPAGCDEPPTDNMDDETRVSALCPPCAQKQWEQQADDDFASGVEAKNLPTDSKCGNNGKAAAAGCVVQ